MAWVHQSRQMVKTTLPNGRPSTRLILEARTLAFHQLRAFPKRCPRMTCSTNSSPKRLVNGPEPNKKR